MATQGFEPDTKAYYRGLNNYQHYFGGSSLYLQYNGPQNPILIIKAPILQVELYGVGDEAFLLEPLGPAGADIYYQDLVIVLWSWSAVLLFHLLHVCKRPLPTAAATT